MRSADGYDINFATNTLGPHALTLALEPLLHASAPARVRSRRCCGALFFVSWACLPAGTSPTAFGHALTSESPASSPTSPPFTNTTQVIFVSSGGQYTEGLEVDDLEGAKLPGDDATRQYAQDKRRQVALAERWAARWAARGGAAVAAYSMHPGWAETEGVKTSIPGFYNAFKGKLRDLAQGADTVVWLCLQDMEKLEPGAFYLDRSPQAKHLALAGTRYAPAAVDRLWERLGEMAAPALPAAA